MYEGEGVADEDGVWEILADRSKLSDGKYLVEVESTDKEGNKAYGEFTMEVKGTSDEESTRRLTWMCWVLPVIILIIALATYLIFRKRKRTADY